MSEDQPSAATFDVCAELSGNVFRILVAAGDQVAKGEQLMVLESMKMEIPVIAPAAGRVHVVNATQDAVVQEGDVVVQLAVGEA